MNILFSAGYMGKIPFANNNIEILLADTLTQKGHNCFVTGLSFEETEKEITDKGSHILRIGLPEFYLNAQKSIANYNDDKISIAKFIFRHPIYAVAIFMLKTGKAFEISRKKYTDYLKKYVEENNIDAVIGFCYPFEMAQAVINSDLPVKKIYYQFDPHGLHETLPEETRQRRINAEAQVIANSHRTFTTRVMAQQYSKQEEYKDLIYKITGVDFPVLKEKEVKDVEIPFEFKDENINILFCGTMDDGFRNPDYLFGEFEKIFAKQSNIKLYFLGPQQGIKVTQWAEKYPDNIFIHPGVKNEIAVATTYKADILLNIGNSISNMVPSKIFDYFATGKPVINVQKIEKCPAQQYFEKYPLQFTVKEYSEVTDWENLYGFIKEKNRDSVSFEKVKEIYYEATPEHVASLIEEAIK